MYGIVAVGVSAALSALHLEPAVEPATTRESQASARVRITRHYDPPDRETGRYQYVPFDIPPGATSVSVEYQYDRANGANVIDLGLFEPGPLTLGTASFRGWSGGERSRVTLTPVSATPGYAPGPLPPGQWHAALGLYRIAPGGVDVEITVEQGHEPNAGSPPIVSPPRATPLRVGPAWYAGGLHLHTVHSDGVLTVAGLARSARAAGLDFIAITDHNNTMHQFEQINDDAPLRIVGEEITTPGGHANVWGLGPHAWIDFRVRPEDHRIDELVKAADDRGALFSINHPRSDCLGCAWQHEIPAGVDAIEIWNGRHAAQAGAVALWDSLLRQGRRVTAVGTSDWHRPPAPMDAASVRVYARELSTAAVLAGLAEGRAIVMADATSAPPVMSARAGQALAGIGDTLSVRRGQTIQVDLSSPATPGGRADLYWNGEVVASTRLKGTAARFERSASADGYLRVHAYRADGSLLAITNPIYVRRGNGF